MKIMIPILLCILTSSVQARTQVEKARLMKRLFSVLYEKIDDAELRYQDVFPITIVRVETSDDDIGQLLSYVPTTSPDGTLADINICYECINGTLALNDQNLKYEKGSDLNRKPSKTNMTIIENDYGLAYRISSAVTGRIIDAGTVTDGPNLENRTEKKFSYYKNQERQYEGRSIYHSMFDLGIYPDPHIAWNYLEQWDEYNEYLSGFSLSLAVPGLGLGVALFKALSSNQKLLIGTKVYANLFNVLQQTVSGNADSEEEEEEPEEDEEQRGPPDGVLSDNLVTVALQVRYELMENGRLGVMAFVNTDGAFGVGLSF